MDSGNTAWMLTSAALVFLMTLAFFYGGMVRAKAVLNMLMLSAAALSVTAVVWTLWGWSIAYAGSSIGGIFGYLGHGFLPKDTMVFDAGTRQYTAAGLAANGNKYPSSVDVLIQVTFAMITVALICGAIAERVKYSTWMLFVALWVTFDYAPMAHMVWNNGLLSAKGPISTAIGAAVNIRRRHGRSHQRRNGGPYHRADHRQAQGFRHAADSPAQRAVRHAGRVPAVVRLVRLQRRLGVRGQWHRWLCVG